MTKPQDKSEVYPIVTVSDSLAPKSKMMYTKYHVDVVWPQTRTCSPATMSATASDMEYSK